MCLIRRMNSCVCVCMCVGGVGDQTQIQYLNLSWWGAVKLQCPRKAWESMRDLSASLQLKLYGQR